MRKNFNVVLPYIYVIYTVAMFTNGGALVSRYKVSSKMLPPLRPVTVR